jgi:3-hydroxyisobutyrate dehydrogenase-like beta-hydroxyacid dehydrogenase
MTRPDHPTPLTIALIGFGEVGGLFAQALRAFEHVALTTYDLKFDQPAWAPALFAKAQKIGVTCAKTASEAAAGADIIISAVTADQAGAVAAQAALYLKPQQFFFDINSASPDTKKKAAAVIAPSGAFYVEGAVMAPVPGVGLKVPILAGGQEAQSLSALLNPLGMNIKAVTTQAGRAAATKLCRSIMIKGIEALIIDCATAAHQWGMEAEVFASLTASFPSIDFAALATAMQARVREHGVRRAAEMREAALMLDDLGLNGDLARAVADAQQRGAAPPSSPYPEV